MRYVFGGLGFNSKDAVWRHAAAVRRRYPHYVTISRPEDIAFVSSLLNNHLNRAEKVGCGVVRFFSAPPPDHPGECFYLERRDGSTTDFGLSACLRSPESVNLESFHALAQPHLSAVRDQRTAGRSVFVSDFSGVAYSVWDAVATNTLAFRAIVDDFCAMRGIDISKELLTDSIDLCSVPVWREPRIPEDFVPHHASYEVLLVSKEECLSGVRVHQNSLIRASGNRVKAPPRTVFVQ